MAPIVNGLEESYGKDFKIVRVDIDTAHGKQLARDHSFMGQPTYLFFDDSGEEVRRLMGAQSSETLQREIDRILGK